jgi:hypothetical protein
MAKYLKYQRKPRVKKRIHPIWRGIGCIAMIFIPLLAFWMRSVIVPLIVASGKIPYQLLGPVHFPKWLVKIRIFYGITRSISSIDNLWLNIITFFVMLLILIGVPSLVAAIAYTLFGPPRYTDVDAPPSKRSRRVYKR